MEKEYVSLEVFAKRYGIKPKTIIKRKDIPFTTKKIDGIFTVEEGERYPYDKKHLKNLHNKPDSYLRYQILKATSLRRYIDHNMLGIEEYLFDLFIDFLMENGFFEIYPVGNAKGANAYRATELGESFINEYEKVKNDEKFDKLERLFGIIIEKTAKGITTALIENINKNHLLV